MESTVRGLKHAGRQVLRHLQGKGQGIKGKNGKQVNVLDEQEKAGEDAEKDTGGLSNALCAVSISVMSDEVENDWTEVNRGRRSGHNRTFCVVTCCDKVL